MVGRQGAAPLERPRSSRTIIRVGRVVQQVEADPAYVTPPRLGNPVLTTLPPPMATTQPSSPAARHRLGADREAGHPGGPERGGVTPFVGTGVRLEGHLGPGVIRSGGRRARAARPCRPRAAQTASPPPRETVSRAGRPRPIAASSASARSSSSARIAPTQRSHPCLRPTMGGRPGIDDEVAVGTDRDAERDVDVEHTVARPLRPPRPVQTQTSPLPPRRDSPVPRSRLPRPHGRQPSGVRRRFSISSTSRPRASFARCGRCTGRPRSG